MSYAAPISIALLAIPLALGCGHRVDRLSSDSAGSLREATVDASCGQCQFGMPGQGCDLAVRIDGVPYFVDGSGIDDHGDAHATEGLCNTVRQARVSGTIVDGRFVASELEVLP